MLADGALAAKRKVCEPSTAQVTVVYTMPMQVQRMRAREAIHRRLCGSCLDTQTFFHAQAEPFLHPSAQFSQYTCPRVGVNEVGEASAA
jgi:hypothetical protein